MSETVKLVIEIPKETYLGLRGYISVRNAIVSVEAIHNGVPLDEIKAKIETDLSWEMFDEYGNETTLHKELMEILDNIGKGGEE